MAKDGKFGTFGGVFTPSILTILGVIMYLRLPWVVGEAGLWTALGIIAVAHVISVTTGLSISSIATDKSVGAGGPYYIVSRSLGLAIGGTLGLALFVGLAFSISLYVIGFTESLLTVVGAELTPTNIRIYGTITVIAITLITLISTAFAIKTQYLILGLIGASLVMIFAGGGGDVAAAEPAFEAAGDGADLGVIFGIFFPAVTGFTAGVNMSGDLRDPKKSIPRGTMAAILVGMVVYVGLAVFLAYRADRGGLRLDSEILVNIAWWGPAVVAGIWGATLSSAIGSILGAPRILQALSVDRITPKLFGRGSGKSNEPRVALVVAFAIAEGGILIAELDAIARLVSVVFLSLYGVLNLSCAIESWASPDFRPEFRIPRLVSIIGAVTCVVVMIQLDLAAMAGATVLLSGLFLYLKRKQLTLEAGDTWEGIWSSIVRAGLHRLSRSRGQRRNWRPNMLLFTPNGGNAAAPMLDFATALVSGNGMVTQFDVGPAGAGKTHDEGAEEEPPVGVFRRSIESDNFLATVTAACRHHGFTGLDPNAVMVSWASGDQSAVQELVKSTAKLDFNLFMLDYDADRGFAEYESIDVWWRPGHGNVALSLAIVRFLTRHEPWLGAKLRFLLATEDSTEIDNLRTKMRSLLADARVEASVKVLTIGGGVEEFSVAVRHESESTGLTIVGLPSDARLIDEQTAELQTLCEALGTILFLRGASLFPEVLPVREGGARVARRERSTVELPDLMRPPTPELAREADAFSSRIEPAFVNFHETGLVGAVDRDAALVQDVKDLVTRQFEILRKTLADTDRARGRKPAGRAQSGLLFQARKLLSDFEAEQLPAQQASVDGRLEACLSSLQAAAREAPEFVRVVGRTEAFRPDDDDPPKVRRFKRRRRIIAFLTRRPVSYEAPVAALTKYFVRVPALEVLRRSFRSFEAESYRMAVRVGKILNAATTDLANVASEMAVGDITVADVDAAKDKVLGNVNELAEEISGSADDDHRAIVREARRLSQRFADDLERVDLYRLVAKERRVTKEEEGIVADIRAGTGEWRSTQTMLLQRAQLGLLLAAFQHRFGTIATRARSDVALEIRNGVLAGLNALISQLEEFLKAVADGQTPELSLETDHSARFNAQAAIDGLTRDFEGSTEELPESRHTLPDEVIARLETGGEPEIEELAISVRPLVRYLIETEFVAVISQKLTGIPVQEERALGVAEDATRLIEFSLGDLDAMGGWRDPAFREQIVSVVKSGLGRLQEEAKLLRESVEGFEESVQAQLDVLIEGTNPYALTTHSDNLTLYIRSREGKKAVSRVRELWQRISGGVRAGVVSLLYRRSAGQLLARRLRSESDRSEAVFDRAVRLTRRATPPAKILRSLPFYYRQLFSGQATISETFWVGREPQLEAAKEAVRAHGQGAHGAIFVVGEVGSGKTALCQVIAARQLAKRRLYRIVPPPGGSIDPAAFKRVLHNELKNKGDYARLFRAVPDGAVFLLDDLEMWWERAEGGDKVLELILGLIESYGDRFLFIVNLNRHAYRLLGRFSRLGERALAVIECEPLSAEDLKTIIMRRHASTGFDFRLGPVPEGELAPWRQARLFTRYFDYSRGIVGAALRAWLTCIDKIDGNTLVMRSPEPLDADIVDHLRVEFLAILVQLVVHKQVTLTRLERLTGLGPTLRADVERLVRMGLVRRNDQNVLHVDRFVSQAVTARLKEMGLLR